MPQYWHNMGAVSVRDAQGRINEFDSLDEACRFLGDRCLKLTKGHLGSWMAPYNRPAPGSAGYYWGGDSHIVVDDLGLLIPVWKIKETYLNLPLYEYKWWRCYGGRPFRFLNLCHYNRDRDFRNGTVPGIGHSTCWRSGGSPRLRTTQEIRENDFVEFDEDCREYEITVRAARRRPAVPSRWDDKPRARRGRGWKQQERHTQWRSRLD